MPAASTSTPPIWTNVSSRYSQSSAPKDVANQVKFIHAHQIAKNTSAYDRRPAATCSSISEWCSEAAAMLTATTKTRSKNSSRDVAVRPGSSGSRGRIDVQAQRGA